MRIATKNRRQSVLMLFYPRAVAHRKTSTVCVSDTTFQTASAKCNAANCTVVTTLSATNQTYAACGIPIRDESKTMIAVTASMGALAVLMVILRLIYRFFSSQVKLGLDDLLIGLAGVSRQI